MPRARLLLLALAALLLLAMGAPAMAQEGEEAAAAAAGEGAAVQATGEAEDSSDELAAIAGEGEGEGEGEGAAEDTTSPGEAGGADEESSDEESSPSDEEQTSSEEDAEPNDPTEQHHVPTVNAKRIFYVENGNEKHFEGQEKDLFDEVEDRHIKRIEAREAHTMKQAEEQVEKAASQAAHEEKRKNLFRKNLEEDDDRFEKKMDTREKVSTERMNKRVKLQRDMIKEKKEKVREELAKALKRDEAAEEKTKRLAIEAHKREIKARTEKLARDKAEEAKKTAAIGPRIKEQHDSTVKEQAEKTKQHEESMKKALVFADKNQGAQMERLALKDQEEQSALYKSIDVNVRARQKAARIAAARDRWERAVTRHVDARVANNLMHRVHHNDNHHSRTRSMRIVGQKHEVWKRGEQLVKRHARGLHEAKVHGNPAHTRNVVNEQAEKTRYHNKKTGQLVAGHAKTVQWHDKRHNAAKARNLRHRQGYINHRRHENAKRDRWEAHYKHQVRHAHMWPN